MDYVWIDVAETDTPWELRQRVSTALSEHHQVCLSFLNCPEFPRFSGDELLRGIPRSRYKDVVIVYANPPVVDALRRAFHDDGGL